MKRLISIMCKHFNMFKVFKYLIKKYFPIIEHLCSCKDITRIKILITLLLLYNINDDVTMNIRTKEYCGGSKNSRRKGKHENARNSVEIKQQNHTIKYYTILPIISIIKNKYNYCILTLNCVIMNCVIKKIFK
ncbi:hypothetical protein V1477_014518 [Vespula maculifrons]|uniref:Uncharacterized protein n=1 Tax=Vespula maculifrons TaxID=7453 RepID=A0ABD2BHP7_VESMC